MIDVPEIAAKQRAPEDLADAQAEAADELQALQPLVLLHGRHAQFLLFSIPAALFVRPRTEWTSSATPKLGWSLLVALALAFALNRGALARGVPIGFHH